MYRRSIEPLLSRFAKLYPIVGITGPRQSGKTTIAKELFSSLPYVSLENLDIRLQASHDPRKFLFDHREGAIFDEVQHVPELLSYLQGVVDERPSEGRFILTGSQNFALNHHISQSLSGRIGMATLLPLSMEELGFHEEIRHAIFRGGYPGLHHRSIHPLDFYPSYIQTYIERDVRQLKNIGNYELFQNFLKLCAARIGQVVNFSSLAQDCGISHTTAREWLNVLKASYILFFLQPFYRNFNKRVIKMPKIYFYDTGLACALLGLERSEQVETHYLKGPLFENLVVLEILKLRLNQALPANLYFWRDQTGHEVDLLGEWGGTIHAMEIKSSYTFQTDSIRNVRYFCELTKEAKGYLLYPGAQSGSFSGIELLPIQKIPHLFMQP